MITLRLQASNKQWVAANLTTTNVPLSADRSQPGPWETFTMDATTPGGSIAHDSKVYLKASNNMYVSAEGGGGRELVANRPNLGPWETFVLKRIAGPGPFQINDSINLQVANGQYVCAEGGGGRELIANRSTVGPWETFGTPSLPAPWTGKKRVRIEIEQVGCADTEDVTGGDEFMAIGAGADKLTGINKVLVSIPIVINNGQTKLWSVATTQRVLFEGDVDASSTILVDCSFYDEDDNKNWSDYANVYTAVSKVVIEKWQEGKAENIKFGTNLAGAVLAGATLLSKLDKNDILGNIQEEYLANSLPVGKSYRVWPFVKGKKGDWSSWNYQVQVGITVF